MKICKNVIISYISDCYSHIFDCLWLRRREDTVDGIQTLLPLKAKKKRRFTERKHRFFLPKPIPNELKQLLIHSPHQEYELLFQ